MVTTSGHPFSNRPVTAEVGDFSAQIYGDFFESIGYDRNNPVSKVPISRCSNAS